MAKQLAISEQTLGNWRKAAKAAKRGKPGSTPITHAINFLANAIRHETPAASVPISYQCILGEDIQLVDRSFEDGSTAALRSAPAFW